jgi:hypothetical protein
MTETVTPVIMAGTARAVVRDSPAAVVLANRQHDSGRGCQEGPRAGT